MELQILTNVRMSAIEFEAQYRACKPLITLDGIVDDASFLDLETQVANYNHHQRNREQVRCTSYQVYMDKKSGKLKKFNIADSHIYANHGCPDIAMAYSVLSNEEFTRGNGIESKFLEVLSIEDELDTTGGARPRLDAKNTLHRQMAWMFQPVMEPKIGGKFQKMTGDEIKDLIYEVGHRITEHCYGNSQEIDIDFGYKILHKGKGWAMIEELGPYAKNALFSNGINTIICASNDGSKNHIYSVICNKPNPHVTTERFVTVANAREISLGNYPVWGGGGNAIGCLNRNGSINDPDDLYKLIIDEKLL